MFGVRQMEGWQHTLMQQSPAEQRCKSASTGAIALTSCSSTQACAVPRKPAWRVYPVVGADACISLRVHLQPTIPFLTAVMVLKAPPVVLQETITAMGVYRGQWAVGSILACCTAGQHLLSAVCDEVAGTDTVSWELHPRPAGDEGSDSVCVDLAIPHLSSEQMQVNYAMLGTACQHKLCIWNPPHAMQEVRESYPSSCAVVPLGHAVASLADVT